eukprot:6490066-Pyramimonas_sp.AAC.1
MRATRLQASRQVVVLEGRPHEALRVAHALGLLHHLSPAGAVERLLCVEENGDAAVLTETRDLRRQVAAEGRSRRRPARATRGP